MLEPGADAPEGPGDTLPVVDPPAAEGPGAATAGAGTPATGGAAPAVELPVARVLVDTGLPHLDREFDYAVPPELAETARPGVRVKVRFAGKDRDGYLVARSAGTEHEGRLTPLRRVVGAEPVLVPSVLEAARRLAADRAGLVTDVLRLAVPPRHARAEAALAPAVETAPVLEPVADDPVAAWAAHPAGPALLARAAAGEGPRAVWQALPDAGHGWPRLLAAAARAVREPGGGVLVLVPDGKDVERVLVALRSWLGKEHVVALTADQGPQARYTAFLKVLRGHVRCVVGTRGAALAPVRDLRLVLVWDDGDDLLREPRAPYPHVRDIALARADVEGCAVVLGGYARSVPAQALLESGTFRAVVPSTDRLVATRPRVRVAGEGHDLDRDPAARTARLPGAALQVARAALGTGPVLVQVPRRGYLPAMSCQGCRARIVCPRCQGPVVVPAPQAAPVCAWCGRPRPPTPCEHCGETRLRSVVVGERRTAEELGRAFPGVPVTTSGGASVVGTVPTGPRLVVATPGAEPVAPEGYAAVLLLDAWALLDRPGLDAPVEALRRWLGATALGAPGVPTVVCGVPVGDPVPTVEALVRWDPAWLAARELAERRELGLPPAGLLVAVDGARAALRQVQEQVGAVPGVLGVGPQPLPQRPRPTAATDPSPLERLLVRGPSAAAPDVMRRLTAYRVGRSARKETPVTVTLDPPGML